MSHAQAATNNIVKSNIRTHAIAIAQAAKKLNDLRENWLNPPEWTHKVPEVIPLGMDKSPYPDRIEPKPAWLQMADQPLDQAVASADGWAEYTVATSCVVAAFLHPKRRHYFDKTNI